MPPIMSSRQCDNCRWLCLALFGATAIAVRSKVPPYMSVDVMVYAANPAGIGAAIAAAANGSHSVALFEPLTMIGGMGAAGGVGLMNQGCGLAGVTGLGREWGLLNGAYYNGAVNPPLNVFPDMFVAEQSFWIMLNATPGVTVWPGCRLVDVSRNGTCVSEANLLCAGDTVALTVAASVFIDASYDGDVMVAAGGIDFAHGREGQDEFNESLAGVSVLDEQNESFDRQNLSVSAAFPNGTFLPGISTVPLPVPGTADDSLMAFAYFACVSDTPGNMIPYPRPADYDPNAFALLQEQIEGVMSNGMYPNGPGLSSCDFVWLLSWDAPHVLSASCFPPADLSYFSEYHQYDTNRSTKLLLCCGVGPVNCDEPGLNAGWATANYSERLRIAAAHKAYLLGSLYYMANEPRVPNYTRYAIGRWGLCADEYAAFDNWPPQLYIRVSNRLRGQALLTQNNIANPRSKPDGVSMGCWEFDQHTVTRHAVADPHNSSRKIARNEGYFRNDLTAPNLPCTHPEAACSAAGNWYDVPFGVMLPKRGQVCVGQCRQGGWRMHDSLLSCRPPIS